MSRSTWFRWSQRKAQAVVRSRRQGQRTFYKPQLERLEERSLLATFTVGNTGDSGAGSLRQAILDANSAAGPDLIRFNIGAGGVQTISPTSSLPTVTGPVVIDGTTQPGFAGSPLIELNGASAGFAFGLVITGGGSTVRGLAINRFEFYGIELLSGGGNLIEGNFIGTDGSGTLQRGNDTGIFISNSANNIIGGATAAARNVISGNRSRGLQIEGSLSTGNQVLGNFIGVDQTGTKGSTGGIFGPNAGLSNSHGITISNAPNNVVGGTTTAARNIISGNGFGVEIVGSTATGNLVQGNYIGTSVTGMAALPNGGGVSIHGDASNNTIGGTVTGAGNVISGNNGGITLGGGGTDGSGVTGNIIAGNFIGTNALGTAALGNEFGITITGAHHNTIGGPTAAARNLISGSLDYGLTLLGDVNAHTGEGNVIQGNFIGTDVTGMQAIPNGGQGVQITGASGTQVLANVISASGGDGVNLFGPAFNNVFQGNFIGVNAAGTAPLGNAQVGLVIHSAPDNTIGGTSASARNIISANGQGGIKINGLFSTGNLVQGNYIGTDVTGNQPLGNGHGSVNGSGISLVDANNNTIGGTTPGAGNVIADSHDYGLAILATGGGLRGSGNTVQGNFIGTNATGTSALGNGLGGLRIQGPNNTLGGATPGARNVISANAGPGVTIEVSAANNVLQGNLVGVNAAGNGNLGNAGHGVVVYGSFDFIPPRNNSIGGTAAGAGNTIAFNQGDGVFLAAGTGNAVLGNSLFSNTELGIDLGENPFNLGPNGVTPNDAGDGDTGANNLQNFPVLTYAESGSATLVQGTLNSKPGETFRLEFFSSAAADPSGFGEGQAFLGSALVTTDAGGNATVNATLNIVAPAGRLITATATRMADTDFNPSTPPVPADTSEFSAAILVNSAPVAAFFATDVAGDGTAGFLAPRTVSLDPSPSLDAEGDAIVKYRWNFGDGSPLVETTGAVVHTYATVANFTATLIAFDARGAQGAPATLSIATRGAVSGTIFEDKNGNGTRDAGEIGFGGQTVFIDVNKNGAFDAGLIAEPNQTSASGDFSFANVGPGIQHIRLKPAAGLVVTSPTAGFQAVDYANTINATGRDLGVFRSGSITGLVFDDKNGNGIKDISETVTIGTTVYLDLDNDNVKDLNEPTANTDISGKYTLPQVIGSGSPAVRPMSLTAGQYVTNPGGRLATPLTSGGLANLNLGLATRGTVSGLVFADLDGDGILDPPGTGFIAVPGEPGIAGRTVGAFLDANGNKLFDAGEKTVSTITDSAGKYTFDKLLEPGTWRVAHVLAGGWIASSPASNAYDIVVTSGSTFTNKNFSGFKPASIAGAVFDDANGNGRLDQGEAGLGNWKVFLDLDRNGIRTANEPQQLTSDLPGQRGEYLFENLRPGTYRVREVLQPGFKAGNPQTGFRDVKLISDQAAIDAYFANYRAISLSGLVFNDLDGDGIRDAGETARPGRIVILERITDAGQVIPILIPAVTSLNGGYQFRELAPGKYRVRLATSAIEVITSPPDGIYTLTLLSGLNVSARDFGVARLLPPFAGRR